ncbi:MAG: iron-sulfur cluster insertion protein ErpA [Rhodospirillales bacterium]|jgi:iron-sulfur cluster assembly accessory protein|nr:iron-sulfur cluster insertion protein ErpA [Rhodospirillales bacterium]MBT4007000.1 iron-sulfur cluster insertion protein ErpA [Rhodospirillales bacterium]MBT5075633.1 iron-sulfur cluster insertion protein ErpA [Rhodospirillales bacterium]MBT5112860.1 iron-sulfur cluster insertion protein ErpA [Rhodospirillales bacterium]MBT5673631.1 iron-sulfur cluster insertion protein ErpA [Rhodospirillales bacterium]
MEPTSHSSGNPTGNPESVVVSAGAVKRIKELLVEPEHVGRVLRVAVDGGGCSGFAYEFSFDDGAKADDIIIEKDGITLVVDKTSLGFLSGSEIDYLEEMVGAAFKVHNPNAVSSCGCGNSFSVG